MNTREAVLRPLALFTLSFYALSCFLCHADKIIRTWAGSSCLLLFVLLCAARVIVYVRGRRRKKKSSKRTLLRAASWLVCGILLACAFSYYTYDIELSRINSLVGKSQTAEGTVSKVLYSKPYGSSFVMKTKLSDNIKVRILVASDAQVTLGTAVRCRLTFKAIDKEEEANYLSNGIVLRADAESTEWISGGGFDVEIAASRLNSRLTGILSERLGERDGGLCAALLLGNKSCLEASVRRDFRRLGISHLLALSGLHLSVITGAAAKLFSRFGRKTGSALSVVCVIFYMFLTGLSPSVTRSGIMLIIMIAASMFHRSGDSVTNLGIAAFLICCVNPYSALDIGLQLSVLAVFALLIYGGRSRAEEKSGGPVKKALHYIVSSVGATVSVLMMTLPLMWLYFGSFALLSPVTTLIFSPLVSVILIFAPFIIILSPSAVLSYIPAVICKAASDVSVRLSAAMSDIPNIVLPLGGALCAILCITTAAAFFAFAVMSPSKKRIAAAGLCACLFAAVCATSIIGVYRNSESLTVRSETDFAGDALTFVSDGKACVIDIGNGDLGALNEALYTAEGSAFGETETLVLSQFRKSYTSTLPYLCSAYKIRRILIPDTLSESEATLIGKSIADSGTKLSKYSYSRPVPLGSANVEIKKPQYIIRSVQPIFRVNISNGEESFVYLGCAYNEIDPYPDIPKGCTVVLGSYGPKYKKSWSRYAMRSAESISALGKAADFAPLRGR